MRKLVSSSMKDLDLRTLCQGIVAVKDNALDLLEDAKILRANNKLARSYAVAYMACEEIGKLSILLGAATQIIIGHAVDWKSTAKRFRSHDSKASQFMGLANAIPILESAIKEGQKSVSIDEVLSKAFVGVNVGPMLFQGRNASLYCDFVDGLFKRPSDVITSEMVDRMIDAAEINIRAATVLACDTAEETAEKLKEQTSAQRYESIVNSTHEFVDEFYANLRSKEEREAMVKEIYARKASKK
ncbi:AbiV family abortive infection protein [Propylenella binzhouense]